MKGAGIVFYEIVNPISPRCLYVQGGIVVKIEGVVVGVVIDRRQPCLGNVDVSAVVAEGGDRGKTARFSASVVNALFYGIVDVQGGEVGKIEVIACIGIVVQSGKNGSVNVDSSVVGKIEVGDFVAVIGRGGCAVIAPVVNAVLLAL